MAENAPPPIQQRVMDGLKRLSPAEIQRIVSALHKLTDMLDIQDLDVE
jgi:uncharacterized membrane protein YgcG